jgi:hypothetical protein
MNAHIGPACACLLSLLGVALIVVDSFALAGAQGLQRDARACDHTLDVHSIVSAQARLYQAGVKDLRFVVLLFLIFDCLAIAKYVLLKGFFRSSHDLLHNVIGQKIGFMIVTFAYTMHCIALGAVSTARLSDQAVLVLGSMSTAGTGIPPGCIIGTKEDQQARLVAIAFVLNVMCLCLGHACVFVTTKTHSAYMIREEQYNK